MALSPEMIAMIAQRANQYASAAPQFVLGGWQFLNAIKQAKKNQRPEYLIDPAYQNQIDTLTNTLGYPQSALDLYYRNIGQNTNQGINAINGLGGNANQIASLVGNQNAQFENIAVADALQRKQDIGGINAAKIALAEQRDKAFQLNKFDPYKDKALAIANEKAAGLTNIQGGLNSIYGANANIATSGLADGLNKQGAPTIPTAQPNAITTPNSGVNVNAIVAALTRAQNASLGQQQYSAPPPNLNYGTYNQYTTPLPPNNNLDYQAWFNSIFGAQGLNQQTNQYQYGQ